MGTAGAGLGFNWWVLYASALVFYGALVSCSAPAPIATANPAQPTLDPASFAVRVNIINSDVKMAVAQVAGTTWRDDLSDGILGVPNCYSDQVLYVWAPGKKITKLACTGAAPTNYTVNLEAFSMVDSAGYQWVDSDLRNNVQRACAGCHRAEIGRPEYFEWLADGHSQTLAKPYYWSMYTGMNLNRVKGDNTEWVISPSGHKTRTLNKSGTGFSLDYPGETGNCGYCHTPAAMLGPQREANYPAWLQSAPPGHASVNAEGIACDICHKVVDVILDKNGLPFDDKPGVLSFQFARPENMVNFFTGPFVAPLQGVNYFNPLPESQNPVITTCAPMFSESAFCAVCHYGKFYDTLVYGSYAEWLESSYSLRYMSDNEPREESREYRSCQDCHMSGEGAVAGTLPSEREACSVRNTEFKHFSHDMLAVDASQVGQAKIAGAAGVLIDAELDEKTNALHVTVTTTNEKAGHKLPTDSPLRHLILLVEVFDEQGNLLPLVSGERVPLWGGVNNSVIGMGNYGGLPGKAFANVLMDLDTNETPVSAYWNPTRSLVLDAETNMTSDNRLKPKQPNDDRNSHADVSHYYFAMPAMGEIKVRVRLYYRYAFIDLAQKKQWNDRADVLVTQACLSFPPDPVHPACP